MARLWERADGGYVIHDPLVEEAKAVHERMERLETECGERGHHLWTGEGNQPLCEHCATPAS